jgi:hypothetical protein
MEKKLKIGITCYPVKQYEEIYYRVLGREMPEEMKLEEPDC